MRKPNRFGLVFVTIGLLIGALTLPASNAHASPGTAAATATAKYQIYTTGNEYRAAEQLAPLSPSDLLDGIAQDWANHMAEVEQMYHNPDYGNLVFAVPGWSAAGENVAYGQRNGVAVTTAWFNSPSHHANLMSTSFNRIGVGVAYSTRGVPYYVQVFGTVRSGNPANHALYTDPTTTPPGTTDPQPDPQPDPEQPTPHTNITRLSGSDRYETNAAIVRQKFDTADTIYLVSSEAFPDALAASSAATTDSAPVIMVPSTGAPATTKRLIRELNPAHIVVIGGPDRIPAHVVRSVQGNANVTHIAGDNRFHTSTLIAAENWTTSSTVFIATGNNFPDALALSAAAGAHQAPVILVNGSANSLSAATRTAIASLNPSEIYIAGSNASVSAGIEQQLRRITPEVTRFAGGDRYETSALIASEFFPGATTQYLATGTNYPDALAASVNASLDNAPLLLSTPACQTAPVLAHTSTASQLYLLGSTSSLSDRVAAFARC